MWLIETRYNTPLWAIKYKRGYIMRASPGRNN
jgi:hypothetical protein